MRWDRWLLHCLFFCLPLWPAPSRAARQIVVVLNFGGHGGAEARSRIVRQLAKKYHVLPGERLLDACEQLGIPLKRGKNLARCAVHVRAMAVVGGKTGVRSLSLAVYDTDEGQAVVSGTVPWRPRTLRSQVRQALLLIVSGLRQTSSNAPPPVSEGKETTEAPPKTETEGTKPSAEPQQSGGVVFEPEAAIADDDVDAEPLDDTADVDIDPLSPFGTSRTDSSRASEKTEGDSPPSAGNPGAKKSKAGHADHRVAGWVGFGMWLRSFKFNDALVKVPSYSSGMAFALRLATEVRPAAFFFDNFLANFFARLRYQMTIGLKSSSKDGQPLGTSMRELIADMGYRWSVNDKPEGPTIDTVLGLGTLDFSIDWSNATEKNLPGVGYRFLTIGAGGKMPFGANFGAHARADYRLVFSAGEVEDDAAWFGSSSTGGLSATIGVHARIFMGIIANFEYTYTRYFLSFSDAKARKEADKKAAGGALDQYHGFILNLGYSY